MRPILLFYLFCFIGFSFTQEEDSTEFIEIIEIPIIDGLYTIDNFPAPKNVDSLHSTIITPILKRRIDPHTNLIYCSSFEIVWNGIREEILKEEVMLNKTVWWLEEMNVLRLNNSVSEKDLVKYVGFGKDSIFPRFKEEIKAKFGFEVASNRSFLNTDIIALSFINKELEYAESLHDHGRYFGYTHLYNVKPQDTTVKLWDYQGPDSYIIQIGMKDENEELFLVKMKTPSTLKQGLEEVEQRLAKSDWQQLGNGSLLSIPKIRFNLIKKYSEVEGRVLKNQIPNTKEPYRVALAEQMIRFNMNHVGVSLQSSATVVEEIFAIPNFRLVLQPPFMLIQKEKGKKSPYLVLWIENDELFLKHED